MIASAKDLDSPDELRYSANRSPPFAMLVLVLVGVPTASCSSEEKPYRAALNVDLSYHIMRGREQPGRERKSLIFNILVGDVDVSDTDKK